MGASKLLKTAKNLKNSSSKCTHGQDRKKSTSEKGQTCEIDYSYTLFTVFQTPRVLKREPKMGAKMKSPGTLNHKDPIKKRSKKHTKHKTQKCVTGRILTKKVNPFSHRARQNHNDPQDLQNRLKGLPGASNIIKDHDSDLSNSRKSTASCSVFALLFSTLLDNMS